MYPYTLQYKVATCPINHHTIAHKASALYLTHTPKIGLLQWRPAFTSDIKTRQ